MAGWLCERLCGPEEAQCRVPAAPAAPVDAGFTVTPLVLLLHTAATFVTGFVVGRLVGRRAAAAGDAAASGDGSWRGKKHRGLSSLRQAGRTVAVVTTAALPWRTGTSVNPLLRAAHLATDPHRKVLLVVPWLEEEDQKQIFPPGQVFATREAHADFILKEAKDRTRLPCDFQVLFYDGKYFSGLGSILPVGDVTDAVPRDLADVAVLEEPEHLNWCQHKSRWTDKFNHVVGIMHTNYLAYIADGPGPAAINVAALRKINKWVCRIHCHKVIKLSDAVQPLPRQVTCNVHGVGSNFLDIGRQRRVATAEEYGGRRFTKGAYFIGKAVWGKGYHELIDLMAAHTAILNAKRAAARAAAAAARAEELQTRLAAAQEEEGLVGPEAAALAGAAAAAAASAGSTLSVGGGGAATAGAAAAFSAAHLDVFGSGEDLDAIKAEAAAKGLDFAFYGGRDHADESMHDYQVFVNPSTSDVVATTTAEALAMGKWVVVQDIPCNAFFKQFKNCLTYDDADGFSEALSRALAEEPSPMSDEELSKLSWEAATERLLDVSEIKPGEWPSGTDERYAAMLWRMYRSVTGFSALRSAVGIDSTSPDDRPTDEDDLREAERHADWELWHDLTSINLNWRYAG